MSSSGPRNEKYIGSGISRDIKYLHIYVSGNTLIIEKEKKLKIHMIKRLAIQRQNLSSESTHGHHMSKRAHWPFVVLQLL